MTVVVVVTILVVVTVDVIVVVLGRGGERGTIQLPDDGALLDGAHRDRLRQRRDPEAQREGAAHHVLRRGALQAGGRAGRDLPDGERDAGDRGRAGGEPAREG